MTETSLTLGTAEPDANKTGQRTPVIYRACPICERREKQILIMPFCRAIPTLMEEQSMSVLKCLSCGLVYADVSEPAATAYNESFGSDELQHYLRLATNAEYWAYRTELGLLGSPGPGWRLLDYGAGIGSLMLIARQLGWEVYGVDPSPYAAWARDHLGLDIFVGRLDAAPYPDDFFDAVVMLSTLEHIWHPRHELSVVHGKLRSGGVLLAGGVPNLDSIENLAARKLTRRWAPVFQRNDPPSHINFLTPRTARLLLERIGFSRIRIDTYGSKWISELEVKRQAGRPNLQERDEGRQADLHPFADAAGLEKGLGLSQAIGRWIASTYIRMRAPFGGDKLLMRAVK